MSTHRLSILLAVFISLLVVGPAGAQNEDWRTIEFETTEVTAADVTLSPDGEWLIFTMLGHLFRLPVEGGTAEQLTFGPYYDTDLTISPDGSRVAFVSDRDGSEGNVFVLELATGEINKVTHELSSGRPAWTPDGQALVYLSFAREARDSPQPWKIGENPVPTTPALVRRVALSEGEPETLTAAPQLVRSVFYLPDGRLAWTVVESGSTTWNLSDLGATTRVEVMSPQGIVSSLHTLAGYADPVVASPTGDGLYYRRATQFWASWVPDREDLLFFPFRKASASWIVSLSRQRGWTPRFAVSADNKSVYLSEAGRLWKIEVHGGAREPIAFRARVRLEIQDPVPPPNLAVTTVGSSPPPPLLLRRVRVMDFAEGGFRPETSLFIEQGRIRWIGSKGDRQLPSEIVTVDVGGRFAIPGLFDMHVHVGKPELYLAYGVTSVRALGWGWDNTLADRWESDSDPAPRSFFTGPNLGDQIRNEEDAHTYVRAWKDRGAQFIKIYNTISRPLQQAAAEEARRQGLPVAGHGTNVQEITKNVILGYAFLEHLTAPSRVYDDVLTMLAAAGTRWDPTLVQYAGVPLLLRDAPERFTEVFNSPPPIPIYLRELDTRVLRGFRAELLAAIRAGHRRGVKLQAGTDALPGFLHWELEYFVQAGLSPLEVLRIATQEAAAALGAEDDLGTLEVGKLADLVLLDANPLEDIKNTQTIWRVIKGGWVFDPEELQRAASTSGARD